MVATLAQRLRLRVSAERGAIECEATSGGLYLAKLDRESPATYKWMAYAAIATGLFASVADNGSVTVALPTIAEHFDIDLPTAQWVIIGYALTISALLLPMGRLSDLVGRRRVYIAGFALFVAGAVLSAFAGSVFGLLAPRVLMGAGAAMTQATAMAIVVSAFPESERGKALGLQMSAVGSGAMVGPALGGLIVSLAGWRGVFVVTAALGVVALVAAYYILTPDSPTGDRRDRRGFDWAGAALSGVVLVGILIAVTRGPSVGWTSPIIVGSLTAMIALLGLFLGLELRVSSPMLDVRMFRDRLYAMGVAARYLSFTGAASVRFLMPFYFQGVRGLNPTQIGLLIVPSAVAFIVTGPVGGRLSDRFGWRPFTTGGLVVAIGGMLVLSRSDEATAIALLVLAMLVQSLGTGIFGAPNSSSVLSAVGPAKYGVTSGFLNLVRNVGNVTGIALATAIVTAVMVSDGLPPSLSAVADGDVEVLQSFTSGATTAYGVTATVVVVAAVLSALSPRERLSEEGR